MTNFQELLKRAKKGKITPQEVDMVAEELGNPDSTTDPFTLLHILGEAFAVKYRDLVEGYLDCEEDPMLARLALEILFYDWGETERYIAAVQTFMCGVEWDESRDVRHMAISLAGAYLRSHSHSGLLHKLIEIFESEHEPQHTREIAYCALARAVGRNWNEIPSAARPFDLVREIDPSVLREAGQRLASEGGRTLESTTTDQTKR